MYMKKILLIGAFISSIFTSCSDFLEKNPSTSLPVEEAITSLDDFGNAVNGIYYLMSEDRMTYSADFAIYAGNIYDAIRLDVDEVRNKEYGM